MSGKAFDPTRDVREDARPSPPAMGHESFGLQRLKRTDDGSHTEPKFLRDITRRRQLGTKRRASHSLQQPFLRAQPVWLPVQFCSPLLFHVNIVAAQTV